MTKEEKMAIGGFIGLIVGAVCAVDEPETTSTWKRIPSPSTNSYNYKPFPYDVYGKLPIVSYDWQGYWRQISKMSLTQKIKEKDRLINEYRSLSNEEQVLYKYGKFVPYELEKKIKIVLGKNMLLDKA